MDRSENEPLPDSETPAGDAPNGTGSPSHLDEAPAGRGRAKRDRRLVSWTEDEFSELVQQYYDAYPGDWIVLGVVEEDVEHGRTTAEFIGHATSPAVFVREAKAFRRRHPGNPIRLFSTELAPRPFRHRRST